MEATVEVLLVNGTSVACKDGCPAAVTRLPIVLDDAEITGLPAPVVAPAAVKAGCVADSAWLVSVAVEVAVVPPVARIEGDVLKVNSGTLVLVELIEEEEGVVVVIVSMEGPVAIEVVTNEEAAA